MLWNSAVLTERDALTIRTLIGGFARARTGIAISNATSRNAALASNRVIKPQKLARARLAVAPDGFSVLQFGVLGACAWCRELFVQFASGVMFQQALSQHHQWMPVAESGEKLQIVVRASEAPRNYDRANGGRDRKQLDAMLPPHRRESPAACAELVRARRISGARNHSRCEA